jgi:hypothetical protein
MADLTAQRTLVKSPPELWTELSEVESLAKHLGELGEIKIVKVEPESTVAWEGEEVSGTVELEQSGWGTKVTFTATVPEPGPAAVPEPVALEPEPEPEGLEEREPEPEPIMAEAEPKPDEPIVAEKPPGFLARWLFRRRSPGPVAVESAVVEPVAVEPTPDVVAVEPEPVEPTPEPEPVEPVAVKPEPVATGATVDHVQQVLDGTLDALGQAHHRPFSRG